jgi:DNA-binding PadR family transcriptional regulator
MRQETDQRLKEDLDLFLLALIEEGIATPYRMQTEAGISQGTSLQALKRLVGQKFVKASTEGPRGRIAFQLTAAGRRWMAKGCAGLAQAELTGDFDSVLRKGMLIAFLAKDAKKACQLLRTAASERAEREPAPDPLNSGTENIAQLYARLRRTQAALVITAEAEVLKHAARIIGASSNRKR